MTTQTTRKARSGKPAKPRADFPLFAHNNGLWAKKIRGTLHYFGSWTTDPRGGAALAKWLAENEYHRAGLPVPESTEDLFAIRDLCNQFLSSKQNLVDSGELTPRTFNDYHATCQRIIDQFGKHRPVDSLT